MRSSGILLHISSLSSPYGIGTFGKEAFDFIDFLREAGQTYWQLLPLGPTSFGDSPYQSFSAFALNPYFIDLRLLEKAGLLKKQEFASVDFGDDPTQVDYAALYHQRY
ncbi:MAG: 4-alpha-glucanotransferase, partial [Clostridia bacterium]|nr:4-alpha-glucanotransferase [Clostridia bacterium]